MSGGIPLRFNNNSGLSSVFVADLESFDPENYDPVPSFKVLRQIKRLPLDVIGRVVTV